MKKQILMLAVALSTLAITANAQEKQTTTKTKKTTTVVAKTAPTAKQSANKTAKPVEQKKAGK